jgi:hypothetical protein
MGFTAASQRAQLVVRPDGKPLGARRLRRFKVRQQTD